MKSNKQNGRFTKLLYGETERKNEKRQNKERTRRERSGRTEKERQIGEVVKQSKSNMLMLQ